MDKPKILILLRPAEGGMREHIRSIIDHLQNEFAFTVVCPPERAGDFAGLSCDVAGLPLSGRLDPVNDWRCVTRLCRIVKDSAFACIHAHGFKAAFVARPVARHCNIPCVVTVHGELAHAQASRLKFVYCATERALVRWTTQYITVSEWLAREMESVFKVDGTRIAVIPNGIDLSRYGPSKGRSVRPGSLMVGTVARLAPQKGTENFIRAAAILHQHFPRVHYMIAGDGPLRPALERLSRELGIGPSVTFAGYVQNVPELLAGFDVFVLPSVSEGQGITVLEAMAAGCPVVASAVGGLRELVVDGKNGLLVAPGEPAELAEAVKRLLSNPDYARSLAARAGEDVKRYGLTSTIEKTGLIYRKVLESGGRL